MEEFLDFDQYEIPAFIGKETSLKGDSNILAIAGETDSKASADLMDKILGALPSNVNSESIELKEGEHFKLAAVEYSGSLTVLIFGVLPERIGLNINPRGYELMQLDNGIRIIYSHKLEKIQADKKKKMMLWNLLKQIF